jgi:hypothetical protein
MTPAALLSFRKSRGLSLRSASREWGVTATTIYRWEKSLRPIPSWLARMFEREKPLLKKIEAQEKEISDLLLQIHRNSLRVERLPMSLARPGAVRGGRRAARA